VSAFSLSSFSSFLVCEPGVTKLLAMLCRHRRQWDFEDAALEWLDGRHREEVERGLVHE
jgi:hypothetical protein